MMMRHTTFRQELQRNAVCALAMMTIVFFAAMLIVDLWR
jgi:hypothetical protein